MDAMGAQVEIWKKIVDVQQHFNDLELRIRNFALIVTGAFLGLGANAIKDGSVASIDGHQVSSAALIVVAALVPLVAFYLMDRLWYHRLLEGSVRAGAEAEKKLTNLGLTVDLGSQISNASPFTLPLFKKKVHSRHKMDGFYLLLLLAIAGLALTLALAVKPAQTVQNVPSAIGQAQTLDDAAAKAVCEAQVQDLLGRSAGGYRARWPLILAPVDKRCSLLVDGGWCPSANRCERRRESRIEREVGDALKQIDDEVLDLHVEILSDEFVDAVSGLSATIVETPNRHTFFTLGPLKL